MDNKTKPVTKDPKRQEVMCEDRKKYKNKLKESILNDARRVVKILVVQAE